MRWWLVVVGLGALALACSSSESGNDVAGGDGVAPSDVVGDTVGKDAADVKVDAPTEAVEDAPADLPSDPGSDPGSPDTGPVDVVSDGFIGVPCETACGLGDVKGRVCAPDSKTYVTNAKVYVNAIDCDGNPVLIETLSGWDGNYELKHVPCGTWEVHIQKGSFTHYVQVQVESGKVTDVSNQGLKMCLGATAARLCVITGDWDSIEETVHALGFQYKLYDLPDWEQDWWGSEGVDLLTDLGAMQANCDVLFIDCGGSHCEIVQSEPSVVSNVKTFVQEGGSLYASDFAYCYSEYAWPEYIDFYGPDDEDCTMGSSSGPIQMSGNQKLDATVLDPDLIAYLGKSTFKANFGLGPLVAVDNAGLSLAHVQGFVPKFNAVQPFVISYKPYGAGGGTVIYTNFHNDEQVSGDMSVILNYMVFSL